jgi:hypothetical protein
MLVEEWQARNLYINKTDLENALGVKFDGIKTRNFPFKRAIDKDLLPYCSMTYFDDIQAIALLQGIMPQNYNKYRDGNFSAIYQALSTAIEQGEISNSRIDHNPIDYDDLTLDRVELEKWAKHYGYNWILPPYSPMKITKTDQNLSNSNVNTAEKDSIIAQLQSENAELQARISELENKTQQSVVDFEPVLRNAKAYDVRERETHLLIIGALSDLLAVNKQKYQKGNSGINQSAISKDIETEIIELLQPATKTRTIDTIRARIRESLNLITKAE